MAKKTSSSPIVATAGPSKTSSASQAPLPQQAFTKVKKNKGNKGERLLQILHMPHPGVNLPSD